MNHGPAVPSPSDPAPGQLRSTGDAAMDAQHLRIFQALKGLEASLGKPFALETLGARLRYLEGLVLDHFREEEAFLAAIGYPNLMPHQVEHEVILGRCHDLLGEFSSPSSPPLEQLPRELMTVLQHHIESVDLDYATFLASRT